MDEPQIEIGSDRDSIGYGFRLVVALSAACGAHEQSRLQFCQARPKPTQRIATYIAYTNHRVFAYLDFGPVRVVFIILYI
jgi:hypothetical protein